MAKDKSYRAFKKDFNRRANMKQNNYKPGPGQSAPKSGCGLVLVVAAGSLAAVAYAASEVIRAL